MVTSLSNLQVCKKALYIVGVRVAFLVVRVIGDAAIVMKPLGFGQLGILEFVVGFFLAKMNLISFFLMKICLGYQDWKPLLLSRKNFLICQ